MEERERHNVWEIMAALADSRFELRLIAPREYELVEIVDAGPDRDVNGECRLEAEGPEAASVS